MTMKNPLSRREAIAVIGSAAVGAVAGASTASAVSAIKSATESGAVSAVPFFGAHQAGIETPSQSHVTFVAFDMHAETSKSDVAKLLRLWTQDMSLLANGKPATGDPAPENAVNAANLTFTVGFGYSLFSKVGMTSRWPFDMTSIPSYSIDKLEEQWSDGDVIVQICCDDALTLSHAVREVIRGAQPFSNVRWTQQGFGLQKGGKPQPRNLMGQIDGTGNPRLGSQVFAESVWAGKGVEGWFDGGTSLVLRRIAMQLDTWEMLTPEAQEEVIGRKRSNGAPLTGNVEREMPDLLAKEDGKFVIAEDAHIRRATTAHNIFRRIFNYDTGTQAGLLFATYQSDPAHYAEIQERLAAVDSLNKWTVPVGSGLWVIPGGVQPGDWFASKLFG
jgi:dye decolorizing peroxidase